ncbi:MAG TPA: GNAT family N-acetyltransferase [Stellaceae bacterium]|jgi:ribosomal protein S18 acetylase RimI-like enzyme|nr:GNAT family N-acetyltransferase [Stellaceae bacterium]
MSPAAVTTSVERLRVFEGDDLEDLCEATVAAIEEGGGFGWVKAPARTVLQSYWNGVLLVPERVLFVARLNNTICGAVQLVAPPKNNEAQAFAAQLTGNFLAPWSRGHGLARRMVETVEEAARGAGFAVLNLDVRATQEVAIGLYEAMGFQRWGEHPGYARVDGKEITGYFYFKRLAGRAKGRP